MIILWRKFTKTVSLLSTYYTAYIRTLSSCFNDVVKAFANAIGCFNAMPPLDCISALCSVDEFADSFNFEGWNCGKITTCGDYGQICGGFYVKGRGSELTKTYTNLPAGTYSVELDFIKIDSWFVCVM